MNDTLTLIVESANQADVKIRFLDLQVKPLDCKVHLTIVKNLKAVEFLRLLNINTVAVIAQEYPTSFMNKYDVILDIDVTQIKETDVDKMTLDNLLKPYKK